MGAFEPGEGFRNSSGPESLGAAQESSPAGRRSQRTSRRLPRRAALGRRSFTSTLRSLEELVEAGAQVSVHVVDLDSHVHVLAGDDHVTMPVAGLGVVPLLIEVAAGFENGTLDPFEIVERSDVDAVETSGLWRHLHAPALPLEDLAVLAATAGDPIAVNALLQKVGHDRVRARIDALGLRRTALLDRFRDRRGPDDAPQVAVGSARELAGLFSALVNSQVVDAAVSAQVSEWLSLNQDLSLVASATGLDPFAHDHDAHGLLFVNKTGRDRGVRAEAGVLAGPRAGVAYALIVCFDDLSITHRLRAHDVFRVLGVELMEYTH
ncbi:MULTISPECIES: serine hydrolase [unclassified Microbacterium]|uniref:serine hydrolase n=1 Tax=unclassified Microbacterium TaxID=2609290 RepID=UPI001604F4DA|nr:MULTISPECIES: serine hydrolase [unclassified Microbacterium]QNA93793.1 serine hydrolase [Microbacterium sp. Se63.02b]QYM64088.1 class A beta-lactamase-related serine hydrolase [Microbacterium sp. Se5.02b]